MSLLLYNDHYNTSEYKEKKLQSENTIISKQKVLQASR